MPTLEKLIEAVETIARTPAVDSARNLWSNGEAKMLVDVIKDMRLRQRALPEKIWTTDWLARVFSYLDDQNKYNDDANAFALLDEIGFFDVPETVECPHCGGTGRAGYQRRCVACEGKGEVRNG